MSIKTIYIVGGQKGGVGKTSVCQALCQYLLDKKRDFVLIEGDAQIDDVGRMYRGQVETETINISDDPAKVSNPDVIYGKAIQDDKDVVVNLPSNVLDVFTTWLRKTGLVEILKDKFEGKIRLVKLFVSDGCYESIRQLKKSVASLDGTIPHVIVLNEGRVNAADFSYLEEEDIYQEATNAPNFIKVVNFPALEPSARFYIDKLCMGLRGAYEHSEEEQDFLKGSRIKTFIEDVAAIFDDAQQAIDQWFIEQSDWAGGIAEKKKPAHQPVASGGKQ